MQKNTIDPAEWNEFLAGFSERNKNRRARFEAFTNDGVAEEDEEGAFESVKVENGVATVARRTALGKEITSTIDDVHGITVQLDSDESENTMEFTDANGDMIVLHFESLVDGES